METQTVTTASDESLADLRLLTESRRLGRRDLELEARIRARSEVFQEEEFRKHGLINVAVNFLRETRDEE
jgi:hypothetical protein